MYIDHKKDLYRSDTSQRNTCYCHVGDVGSGFPRLQASACHGFAMFVSRLTVAAMTWYEGEFRHDKHGTMGEHVETYRHIDLGLVVWNMAGLFPISYMGCHPSH